MVKAFFVDFYGTVVHEDGEIIKKITQIICDSGTVHDKQDVGTYWWNEFQSLFVNSFGESFETQRELERRSLKRTLDNFSSDADVNILSDMMFRHWCKPPIFDPVGHSPRRSRG